MVERNKWVFIRKQGGFKNPLKKWEVSARHEPTSAQTDEEGVYKPHAVAYRGMSGCCCQSLTSPKSKHTDRSHRKST